MKPPHSFFEIAGQNGMHGHYGYSTDKFECDVRKLGLRPGEKPLSKSALASGFSQIIAGIDHMHASGYVHQDIKPENMLYNPPNEWRMIDFGTATPLNSQTLAGMHSSYSPLYTNTFQVDKFKDCQRRGDIVGAGNALKARDNFSLGASFIEKTLGRDLLYFMFVENEKGLRSSLLLTKDQFVIQFIVRGYTPELASSLYDLMQLDPAKADSQTPEEARKIFQSELTNLSESPKANSTPAISSKEFDTPSSVRTNELLLNNPQFRMYSPETAINNIDNKSIGSFYIHPGDRSGPQKSNYCCTKKTGDGRYVQIGFNIGTRGKLITSDGREYSNIGELQGSIPLDPKDLAKNGIKKSVSTFTDEQICSQIPTGGYMIRKPRDPNADFSIAKRIAYDRVANFDFKVTDDGEIAVGNYLFKDLNELNSAPPEFWNTAT
jgi:serine/threonine protein kinase